MTAIKKPKEQKMEKRVHKSHKKQLVQITKTCFWFFAGILLGFFFLISFTFIIFEKRYSNVIYPGVTIEGISVGGKSQDAVIASFQKKNQQIADSSFVFTYQDQIATVSAQEMHLGYDSNLLAQQAYVIGRSSDPITNASIIFQAYMYGVNIGPAYTFTPDTMEEKLHDMILKAQINPVDATFVMQDNRVTTFRPSQNGQSVDLLSLQASVSSKIPFLLARTSPLNITIALPIKVVQPKVTTTEADKLGIKERVGIGTSLYQHSIPSRAYNIALAASRINGAIVSPGQEFSFDKTVGDVSSLTGYKQAYVIAGGHTVLGDGGGVCQVSTTLFRAVLNAGLPITERHAHDYRVGYYEEDSPPGFDATVYVPSVDFRFVNNTDHSILIQSFVDPIEMRLSFYLYGTSDGRQVAITTPVVTNQIPPPPPLYQDNPSLPKGTVQQTDFAAAGATVSFSRTVSRNGIVTLQDTYTSVYQPWQAVYMRGPQ
ncbi:MAG TPA: VanW family protein [Patescibacteria group bacterium]|nr:VanW family protein [Patescibacteria group bacterium]